MNAAELHRLARTLREIALDVTADHGEGRASPAVVAVVEDVSHHPATSVSAVATRTGLAQSQVSTTVARLRAGGVLSVEPDPSDGRRNLIRLDPAMRAQFTRRAARTVRKQLAARLGEQDRARLDRVTQALEVLAAELLG